MELGTLNIGSLAAPTPRARGERVSAGRMRGSMHRSSGLNLESFSIESWVGFNVAE